MTVQPHHAVIDLGVVPSADALPADPPRPPVRLRGASRPVAALAVLVALTTLGGARQPPAPAFRHVLTVPAADSTRDYRVSRDALFVLAAEPANRATVTAYDVRDGSRRWSTPLDGAQQLLADDRAGLLIAYRFDVANTTALDPDTGTVRWQRAAAIAGISAQTLLLTTEDDQRRTVGALLVDAGTGAEIWSRDFPPDSTWTVSWSDSGRITPQRIIVSMPDGQTVVYRVPDGVEVARARLGIQAGSDGRDGPVDLPHGGDGVFYVTRPDRSGATVTAYRVDTLTRLWRTRTAFGYLSACGRWLCVSANAEPDPDSAVEGFRGLSALDPRTGAARWARPGMVMAELLNPERILATRSYPNHQFALLDAGTGRVVAALDGLRPVWGLPTVLVRTDRATPGKSVVVRLDHASGALQTLGAIDGVQGDCQGAGVHLACRARTGEITLWTTTGR